MEQLQSVAEKPVDRRGILNAGDSAIHPDVPDARVEAVPPRRNVSSLNAISATAGRFSHTTPAPVRSGGQRRSAATAAVPKVGDDGAADAPLDPPDVDQAAAVPGGAAGLDRYVCV